MSELNGQFLIAMPALADPNFAHTVTLVCEHSKEGAMGLVINRPADITLGEVLDHMDIPAAPGVDRERPVVAGGPVQREAGFVIHSPPGPWESSLRVSEEIEVSSSRDILFALAEGAGPERFLITLGYAGWGPGQLEQELADNAWLSGPADPEILFNTPFEARWQAAAALLGVDLSLLSSEVGHA